MRERHGSVRTQHHHHHVRQAANDETGKIEQKIKIVPLQRNFFSVDIIEYYLGGKWDLVYNKRAKKRKFAFLSFFFCFPLKIMKENPKWLSFFGLLQNVTHFVVSSGTFSMKHSGVPHFDYVIITLSHFLFQSVGCFPFLPFIMKSRPFYENSFLVPLWFAFCPTFFINFFSFSLLTHFPSFPRKTH